MSFDMSMKHFATLMITSADNTPVGRFALALREIRPNAETLLESLPFTPSEQAALRNLGFQTIADAVCGTIPGEQDCKFKGCGPTRTHYIRQKIGIAAQCVGAACASDNRAPVWMLTSRESSALQRLGIRSLRELADADLTKIQETSRLTSSLRLLLRHKQIAVQKEFARIASETPDEASLPIFFLSLPFDEVVRLHSVGITTVGELVWMNPGIFRLRSKPDSVVDRFRELQSFVRSEYPQAYVGRDYNHWTREANEQGIAALPFFSESTNPGFAVEAFHPAYYASRKLARLGLFYPSTLTLLRSAGVVTLGNLLLLTPTQVAIFPAQRIEWVQQRIKAFLLSSTAQLDMSSPERFVRSMLGTTSGSSTIHVRKIECVVLQLLGHTLDEIGKRYGRTRERIRQYIMTTRSLALHGFTAARGVLTDVLNSIGGCSTVESVRLQLIETFGWNEQECTKAFVYGLLHDFFKEDFTRIDKLLYAVPDFSCLQCEKVDGLILHIIKDYRGKWRPSRVRQFIEQQLPQCVQCTSCRKGQTVSVAWIRCKLTQKPFWKRLQRFYISYLRGLRITKRMKSSSFRQSYLPETRREAIRLMTDEKYTTEQAAAQTGCTAAVVRKWAAQRHQKPQKSSDAEATLQKQTSRTVPLSRTESISKKSLPKKKKRLKHPLSSKRNSYGEGTPSLKNQAPNRHFFTTSEERQQIADLYASGLSLREVAAKVGRTLTTVEKTLRKLGVAIRQRGEAGKTFSEFDTHDQRSKDTPKNSAKDTENKQKLLENLVRVYWQDGNRAVEMMLLPPDVRAQILASVSDALQYACDQLR